MNVKTAQAPVETTSLEELQRKCEALVAEKLSKDVKTSLGDDGFKEFATLFMDALCKLDALEDKYDSKTLHVVHFNDVYNLRPLEGKSHDPSHPVGGFSRFVTALKEQKAKIADSTGGEHTPLILFSGDFVGPSLTSAITQGAHIVRAMNHIGVHYGTWGNHEFDFGLQKLTDILEGKVDKGEPTHGKSVTTWIASNMNGADGKPIAGAEKYAVVDWEGVKVGILGSSENWLKNCSKLEDEEGLYLDYVEEANKICAQMRSDGVEVILAVTHNRLDRDKEFVNQVPEVDLLCGGHDHFPYLNLEERIMKGGQEWQFMNVVTITVKKSGVRPKIKCKQIPIFPDIEEDPAALEIENIYEELVNKRMNKVIGVTPVPLESTEEFLRFKESELGNFVADVMQNRLGADIGLIQGFNVSGKYVLKAGEIKLADVYSWFPKGTSCVSVSLTGAQIKELFENGVRSLPGECAGFVHVSRDVCYVMDAGQKPGSRVSKVTFGLDGEPMDLEKEYTCAITLALATARGFGTDFIADAPRVIDEEYAVPLTDMIVEFFNDLNGKPLDSTEPANCGRVIEIHRGETL